jgi:GNAT superfamily N-acetyltransferase
LRFIQELAEYEESASEVVATTSGIQETLFSESATAHALMCLADDTPIGFAVYFFNYSTWQARNGLYLEDLYVSPDQRGLGAGKAILRHLAQLALQNNCGRFEWSVLVSNSPAIGFYDGIGAKPKPEWLGYRLAGEDLERFARAPAAASI